MFLSQCVAAGRCAALLVLIAMPLSLHAAACRAAETLAGPYTGTVERVVDGDTLAVRVPIWIGQDVRVLVRLRGVDAPEVRGECEGERALADAATARMAGLVAGGAVVLRQVEGDKYFGRVVADLATPDGADLAGALLEAGLVRRYEGGRRGDWCGGASVAGKG